MGAEEAETETESSVSTGSVTVSRTSNTASVTALVSGGSSTSGNRASVTNIDTGNTIGTYRRVSSAGTQAAAVSGNSTGDTDNSDGMIETAGTTQDGSTDIVIAAPQPVEPVAEPAPEPEYRTVVSACNIRSYPDYGDNVIGQLYGGETVLFYGLEGGWDKIECNGIVGYIGPKFLQ